MENCNLSVDYLFSRNLNKILEKGETIKTRNSEVMRFLNLSMTFTHTPLISIRRTAWRNALREMEWFLSGSNNINDLHESVRKWWEPWANKQGIIQNNYSQQFTCFSGKNGLSVNQIDYFLKALKEHPYSRRIVGTTWNTAEMVSSETPITNCHGSIIQLFVDSENKTHLTMYQRSCDMILGVPHNLIQYWALLLWLSYHSNRDVGSFHWIGGDCHIYDNHINMAYRIIDQCDNLYLAGNLPNTPILKFTPSSDKFLADDFSLSSKYEPIIHESLPMTV